MNHSIRRSIGILLLVLGSTGCIAEYDDQAAAGEPREGDELQVGEATDAFAGVYFWGAVQNTEGSWPLGPKSTNIGFIQGVSGDLAAPQHSAYVNIYDSGPEVYWQHRPNPNRWLGSQVGTISPYSSKTPVEYSWSQGAGSITHLTDKVPGTKHRCMLTAVENLGPGWGGVNHNAFGAVGDALEIIETATEWRIRATGNAAGRARCIKVTQLLSAASWAWGSADKEIVMGTNQAGMQCYLTGIGGSFRSSDTNNGVKVYLRSDNKWALKVSANKFGAAECSI
jgi:hypothetical protein